MTTHGGDRRWPWFKQAVDLAFALFGLGVGVSMVIRGEYDLLAIILVLACATGVTSSQILQSLLSRWEGKP